MDIDFIASVLYEYVVEGYSMESVGNDHGITTGEVSQIVRSFGFNYENQGSYRSGQHRGAYSKGYRANYCGINFTHTVTEDELYDFARDNQDASVDYPCNPDAFEDYLEDFVIPAEGEQIIEKQNQARLEQQRQAEARQYAEQQRQAEAKRYAEQQRREEYRHLEENQRRAVEQEHQRQKQENFKRLCYEGVQLYKANRLNEALSKFRAAEILQNCAEVNLGIAHALAGISVGNNAAEIRNRLVIAKSTYGHTLTYDEHLVLANAYLTLGDKGNACDEFFFAGDIAYDSNDFELADKIYTEALNKTDYYSSRSKDAPFRIAFAMSNRNNPSDSDYNNIIYWYNLAVNNNISVGIAHNNIASVYNTIKNYDKAVEEARLAILNGYKTEYSYKNLKNAYWNLKDYQNYIAASDEARNCGFTANYFRLGFSYNECGDKENAEKAYKESLRLNSSNVGSYWNLSDIYIAQKRYSEAVEYAEKAMELFSQEGRNKWGAKALEIAKLAGNDAAYNRILQYLPAERERLEKERLEKEQLEKERLEQQRKLAVSRVLEDELMLLLG